MRSVRSIGLLVCVAVPICAFFASLQISVGRQEALLCLSHQRRAGSLMYVWPPADRARKTRDTSRCSVYAIGIPVIYVRCPRHSPHTPTHTPTLTPRPTPCVCSVCLSVCLSVCVSLSLSLSLSVCNTMVLCPLRLSRWVPCGAVCRFMTVLSNCGGSLTNGLQLITDLP